jgi:zinc protease
VIDDLIEADGGWTNAETSSDYTCYYDVSSSAFLERALWLEADRLAGLVDTLDQEKLDNQRDVVRNERRQSYENEPYGMADLLIQDKLWPEGFGYHWPVIGNHEDLMAATVDDVKEFFHRYYVPRNVILVIAGDIDPRATEALIARYLGWIPGGEVPDRPRYATPAPIRAPIILAATDAVEVPRVYLTWRGPARYAAGQAELDLASLLLGEGKSSRLYKRLVFDERIAQDVTSSFIPEDLGGSFQIVITAKPGVAPARLLAGALDEVARLGREAPSAAEIERVANVYEADLLARLETPFNRAYQLAEYVATVGDPGYLPKDVARHRAVTAEGLRATVAAVLTPDSRVELVIAPEAK